MTLQLYATDASHYQIEPAAVAFPSAADHVSRLIETAADAGTPVIPRGAGTGLIGGAIGEGLVMDLSRHNRAITDLNLEKRTVRVGAGVVLDHLNAFLKPHGFRFGPDVATSSRATLGGMIANNSSGSHVPFYGVTADHLESLELVLSDGTQRVARRGGGSGLGGLIEAELAKYIRDSSKEIAERFPNTLLKRWPGYGVDRLLRDPENIPAFLSGSEGTLAVMVGAELNIVPLPSQKGLGLVYFDSVEEAMEAAVELLDLRPAAIEHIDRFFFDLTQGQRQFKAARDLMRLDDSPCESILIVEFFDDVEDKLAQLRNRRLGRRISVHSSAEEMALIWGLRKAGIALLTGRKGPAKPVTCIEDAAIPPKQLANYVRDLRRLLKQKKLEACLYGHAASGLLHVRPVVDLHTREGVAAFREITDETAALVRQYKGSLAAEHGVGMARTEYLESQVGPELMDLFHRVKTLFDPKNRLNPGKIVDTGRYRIDEDLRAGEGHRIELPFQPVVAFVERDESFVGNLEQCNGCGACRKLAPTMCPTYVATLDEEYSTRGRANIIRAALEWRLHGGEDPLASRELLSVLGHCLSCKGCKTECPSNVDLALLKAELLHARHRQYGLGLKERVISSVDWLGQLSCLFPGLSNALLNRSFVKKGLAKFLGMTEKRPLPKYTDERFDDWFKKRAESKPPQNQGVETVYLWDDTFTRYYDPHIGRAAVSVLEAAGFRVRLVQDRECCGRPAFSQGHLDHARYCGERNLGLLDECLRKDPEARVLFLEPSCWSMFAEDYRELKIPGAERLSSNCMLFEDFIHRTLRKEPKRIAFQETGGPVFIHGHCHAKALAQTDYLPRLAMRATGCQAGLMDTGCCGMAGAFGSMEEHYELSVKVAQPMVRLIKEQPQGSVLIASGTSCRHQIEHLTDAKPMHMAEFLARQLANNETRDQNGTGTFRSPIPFFEKGGQERPPSV